MPKASTEKLVTPTQLPTPKKAPIELAESTTASAQPLRADVRTESAAALHKTNPLVPTSSEPTILAATTALSSGEVATPTQAAVLPESSLPNTSQTSASSSLRGFDMAAVSRPQENTAMTQLAEAIRTRGAGRTIEVHLDPPELGRVLIELEVGRNGQVRAVISAAESETLEMMRRNAGSLAQDLEQSGFQDIDLDWQRSGDDADDAWARQLIWEQMTDASSQTQNPVPRQEHDGALNIHL